jgi:phosphatidylinositol glycan class Q protein
LLDTHDSALILGWRNGHNDLFVVDLVSNIYRSGLKQPVDMASLVTKYPFSRFSRFCGNQPLSVLGQLEHGDEEQGEHVLHCLIDSESIYPRFVLGPNDPGVQLYIFDRPDPHRMQYFSMQPVPLERVGDPDKAWSCMASQAHEHSLAQLHINQMNCAREVAAVLQQNLPILGSRRNRNRAQSFHEVFKEGAKTAWSSARESVLAAYQAAYEMLAPNVSLAWHFLVMTEARLLHGFSHFSNTALFGRGSALRDFSVAARELDYRIQKILNWPEEYRTLRARKRDWASITSYHPDYIRFYNGMWLLANDLIFGLYIASTFLNNEHEIAEWIYGLVELYSIDTTGRMMYWLKSWPAGLKLNNELASFFGDLFLWLIGSWHEVLMGLRPYLPFAVRVIGVSGFLGASISVSLISDAFSLLTLHLYVFYLTAARIYEWQITVLLSLFHLFRGKKRNVLRHRIDSCDYDLDQLLLGTILFTLLAFLFPTVLVYYLTFAASRIALKVGKTGLDMVLAFLVQFPLFACLLRIKDARRLPGGIHVTLLGQQSDARVTHLLIESKPLPFDLIFQPLVIRQSRIMGSTLQLKNLLLATMKGTL